VIRSTARSSHLRSRLGLPLLVLFAGSVAACDGSKFGNSKDAAYMVVGESAPAAMPAVEGYGVAGGSAARAGLARTLAQSPGRGQVAADSTRARMLIRTGSAFIRVDSLELAMDAVRQLATSLGGHVGDVSISAGEFQVRSATLQLRVPVARFDDAFTGLKPLGRLENSSVAAQDVGEEFVDVNARMANSRRLESRLVTLLANQTGKLEDVLAVERELARVRQEIESYEARVRYLRNNIDLSTISVTVSERAPVVGPNPGQNVIVEAFKGAWRNFVGLIAFAIESVGVLVPLALAGWFLLRLRRRKRPGYEG
jgi:hypothetical protein